MSDWNRYLDRKLELRLNLEAAHLADALAREVLGYNTRRRAIGQRRLRDLTGFHGRSFERAREELVAAGLFGYVPGTGGRGNRDEYVFLPDETPAPAREFDRETPAQTPAETPAPERGRIEEGVRGKAFRSPAADAQVTDLDLWKHAFVAFAAETGFTNERQAGQVATALRRIFAWYREDNGGSEAGIVGEIVRRCRHYHASMPPAGRAELTPTAVAKWWDHIGAYLQRQGAAA